MPGVATAKRKKKGAGALPAPREVAAAGGGGGVPVHDLTVAAAPVTAHRGGGDRGPFSAAVRRRRLAFGTAGSLTFI